MKYKIQRLQQRIDWLEKGLNNIYQDLMSKPMKARNHKDAQRVLTLYYSAIDGEPPTMFHDGNVSYLDKWEQEHWRKRDEV
tara:strand:+ start:31 stop:273 length:243 start_codon:yes stop_codon:yes gene_type:complete